MDLPSEVERNIFEEFLCAYELEGLEGLFTSVLEHSDESEDSINRVLCAMQPGVTLNKLYSYAEDQGWY